MLNNVDSSAATYTIGTPPDTLRRRDISVTYDIVPNPETTELDFDFIVTGATIPDCPADVSDQVNIFCNDILLPIELLELNAEHVSSTQIKVFWKTASEKSNYGFYIQRSIDGLDFKEIGFVEGQGNTSTISEYQFIDNEYWTGIAYYRLRQVDFDGSQTFTKVVSLTRNETDLPIVLYPNPTKAGQELFIKGLSKNDLHYLYVYNLAGQQVTVNTSLYVTDEGFKIQLPSTLSKGVYILQVVTEFGVENFKFVVE